MLVYCATRDVTIETCPDPIGGGGEGKVFEIPSEPGLLAKIFDKPEEGRREKIQELIANPFPAPGGRFAWPEELLFDSPGKTGCFIGYLMPLIPNGISLSEFIDPQADEYREKPFRVRLAIAVAEIFAEVRRHHQMIVVGDVSPRNLLADAQGRITLIDLDSVQITTVCGRTYRSRARTPYFTPPELSGPDKDLAKEDRKPAHDRFGLAVIIFQLLFDGWHPFAAVGTEPLEERLLSGRWPYAAGLSYQPPPGAPPFADFPSEIQELFRRAFETGHADPSARPTEDEWFDALRRHEKALGVVGQPKPPPAPVLALPPPAVARRDPRFGKAAWAAAAVLVIALGLALPVRLGEGASAEMANVAPATQAPPKPPPPPSSLWEQVEEQRVAWLRETNRLLDLVEEEPPAVLRHPQAAAEACVEEQITREDRTSSNFEYLVRRGDAIEAGLTSVLGAGQRLDELLRRAEAGTPRPPAAFPPPTERNVRLAVAVIPRDEHQPEATVHLRRILRDEFDELLDDVLRELRVCNGCLRRHFHRPDFPEPDPTRCYRWNFSEAIEHAVRLQQDIRRRLGPMRPTMRDRPWGRRPPPVPPRLAATGNEPAA